MYVMMMMMMMLWSVFVYNTSTDNDTVLAAAVERLEFWKGIRFDQ